MDDLKGLPSFALMCFDSLVSENMGLFGPRKNNATLFLFHQILIDHLNVFRFKSLKNEKSATNHNQFLL